MNVVCLYSEILYSGENECTPVKYTYTDQHGYTLEAHWRTKRQSTKEMYSRILFILSFKKRQN